MHVFTASKGQGAMQSSSNPMKEKGKQQGKEVNNVPNSEEELSQKDNMHNCEGTNSEGSENRKSANIISY